MAPLTERGSPPGISGAGAGFPVYEVGLVGWVGMYIFAYGSLLSARSAVSTLPGLRIEHCVPARLAGHIRTFDVAFPNDASQPDKRYYRQDGSRPERVLFANLRPRAGAHPVNGVLLPVANGDLGRLQKRERRYRLVDVSRGVRPYHPWPLPGARICAFVGRPRFSGPGSASYGVVAASYLGGIMEGVRDWDGRCPGFHHDYSASTQAPAAERVVPLRRVDLRG